MKKQLNDLNKQNNNKEIEIVNEEDDNIQDSSKEESNVDLSR